MYQVQPGGTQPIPQVEVSSWEVGDRYENWQGDDPGSAEGSIDSLCVCRTLTGCGDLLTVCGLWLSSGWVKAYRESLFVLHEASREVAHGGLRNLLCSFWRDLATSTGRTILQATASA